MWFWERLKCKFQYSVITIIAKWRLNWKKPWPSEVFSTAIIKTFDIIVQILSIH